MEKDQVLKAIDNLTARPGIPKLAAAYVKARKKITHTVKNASNPHFGSNYATLDAVLDSFQEPFGEEGLALLQAPSVMDGDKIGLSWMLLHESGESISGNMQLPIGPKATAQAAGSTITYARRYNAAAVAGISQVDDDGNAASEAPARKKEKPASSPESEALLADIAGLKKGTPPEMLEAIKARIRAAKDPAIANAFLAKKKEWD